MDLTGPHIRTARAALGWSQQELANASGVALGTIRRMEATEGQLMSMTGTMYKVRDALLNAGVQFLEDTPLGVSLSPMKTRSNIKR